MPLKSIKILTYTIFSSLSKRSFSDVNGVKEIDKARIKRSFSRAARTYDEYAGFQALMAERLMALCIEDASFNRVLDIGSATGRVAMELSALLPEARVYACDISGAMLSRAREKTSVSNAACFERLEFIVSDFEALPFKDASIDLAVSSLAYQWAGNLNDAFKELHRVLAPKGLLIMNTLTRGTLGELKESFREAESLLNKAQRRPFMDFVEPLALRASIEGSGLEIATFNEYSFEREYSSMRELLRTLKNIGALNPLSSGRTTTATAALLKAAEEYYQSHFPVERPGEFASKGVRASYEIVFITASKAV